MRKSVILLILCLITAMAQAQTGFTKTLDGIEWVKIESKADVILKTHDSGSELRIKASSSNKTVEKAKGLRLVGEGGSDNTEVGFYVIQDGNTLLVKNLRKSESAEIYLPAAQNVSVKSTWHGDIEIDGFTGEIEADAQLNGSIRIIDVNGPVTANTFNGDVNVKFGAVNQDSPISIYSTNGAVDISLPENTPANLYLSSFNNDIYTDFELEWEKTNGLKSVSSKKLKASINDGGVDISIKTFNGNIYLRKL